MKRDYKNYFLGKRYKSVGYRLTGALFIFQSILLFLFPVLIWGERWERILACALSFIPLVNLFVYLMA